MRQGGRHETDFTVLESDIIILCIIIILDIIYIIYIHLPILLISALTSRSTAIKRPLPVLLIVVVFVDFEGAFSTPPKRLSVLFLMVSAFSFGASPSMTKTSLIPMSVRDETLKNKFLYTSELLIVLCEHFLTIICQISLYYKCVEDSLPV